MGFTGAQGMREAADLDVAIEWHMTANHFPGYPRELIPVAIKAVEEARDENWDERIPLPEGMLFRGRQNWITVEQAYNEFHLEAFVI